VFNKAGFSKYTLYSATNFKRLNNKKKNNKIKGTKKIKKEVTIVNNELKESVLILEQKRE
jgi:hypothetical protein